MTEVMSNAPLNYLTAMDAVYAGLSATVTPSVYWIEIPSRW